MGFFGKKPGLSERNSHYLCTQILRVYLFISVRIFTKEHPCSQDCIRISDNLKIRLEKLILFAHTDKRTFSDKLTLSACADNVGFSQINLVFLKKKKTHFICRDCKFFQRSLLYLRETRIIWSDNMSFSERPAVSERNPHYLQVMWVRKTHFISGKPILSDEIICIS